MEDRPIIALTIILFLLAGIFFCVGTFHNKSESEYTQTNTTTESTDFSAESEDINDKNNERTVSSKNIVPLFNFENIAKEQVSGLGGDDLIDNYENNYETAIGPNSCYYGNYAYEILLNGEYSTLEGTLYVPKGISSTGVYSFTVSADGNNIYKSPKIDKKSKPVKVNIPVAGYNTVRINLPLGNCYCALGDVLLYKEPHGTPTVSSPVPTLLTDFENIADEKVGVLSGDALTDNYGNRYEMAIGSNSCYSGNYAYECLIDNKFRKLKGVFYVVRGSNGSGANHMTISADGHQIYKSPNIGTKSKPINVDVSVAGHNNISIFMPNGDCYCAFGDVFLYR